MDTLVLLLDGDDSRLGRMSWINFPANGCGFGDVVREGKAEDVFELDAVGTFKASKVSRRASGFGEGDSLRGFGLAEMNSSSSFFTYPPAVLP